jgi:hypothetical protein
MLRSVFEQPDRHLKIWGHRFRVLAVREIG